MLSNHKLFTGKINMDIKKIGSNLAVGLEPISFVAFNMQGMVLRLTTFKNRPYLLWLLFYFMPSLSVFTFKTIQISKNKCYQG